MNNPLRIHRLLVKALAAGALLVAGALPLAVAGVAGAAVAPTLTAVNPTAGTAITVLATGTFTLTDTSGAVQIATVGTGTTATIPAGSIITSASAIGISPTTTITVGVTPISATTTLQTITSDVSNEETGSTVGPAAVTVASAGAQVYATVAGAFTVATTLNSNAVTLTLTPVTDATLAATVPVGSILTSANLGTPTGTYVTFTSNAAITSTATLKLASESTLTASGTSATVNAPGSTNVPLVFGEGNTTPITFFVVGTGYAANGGTVSMTSSDPDLVFTGVTEISSTLLEANVSSTASTTSGTESITLTDTNGTSAALADALTVTPAPTVTSISPTSLPNNQTAGTALTITGTNFDVSNNDVVTLTSLVDGTSLEVSPNCAGYNAADQGLVTPTPSATSMSACVWTKNATTLGAATAGTYALTVTNADGGSVTTGAVFTVTAAGITNVSPSEVNNVVATPTITINGAGFQSGATVALSGCTVGTPTGTAAGVFTADTVVQSPNVVSTEIATTTTIGQCTVTVTNGASGDNGAIFVATSALGIGEAGATLATISAAAISPNVPIVVGSTATTPVTLTLTGTGFGLSSIAALEGTTSTVDPYVTGASCVASSTGTTLTCSLNVASLATAGLDGVVVINDGVSSAPLEGAFTIAGPTITSASPSALAAGAPVGTVITFTGTGFNSTATAAAGGLTGTFAVTSPTTATYALTAVAIAGTYSFKVTQTISAGVTVSSAVFPYVVTAGLTVSSLVSSISGGDTIGAGAVAVPVTITGSNFTAGATIGTFINTYGVADAGVTAKVVSVSANGQTIVADFSIAAGDANISDGYTVTNTNGGVVKVPAFTAGQAVFIDAGPTITTVAPATVTADSTDAFTITGTGFVGSKVQPSADGTCGTATVVSSTDLTVSCTFSAAGATAVSLVVTNSDGGSATSAVVMAAVATTTTTTIPVSTVKPGPFAKRATAATVGRTVIVTITGGRFYGAPKVTSNEAGTTARVFKDTGTVLKVHVSVRAGSRTGEHTFTITNANGKSCKANYRVKA